MIDEIDRHLSGVGTKDGSTTVDVSLTLPPKTTQGQGVSLYFFTLSTCPPHEASSERPVQFLLTI